MLKQYIERKGENVRRNDDERKGGMREIELKIRKKKTYFDIQVFGRRRQIFWGKKLFSINLYIVILHDKSYLP